MWLASGGGVAFWLSIGMLVAGCGGSSSVPQGAGGGAGTTDVSAGGSSTQGGRGPVLSGGTSGHARAGAGGSAGATNHAGALSDGGGGQGAVAGAAGAPSGGTGGTGARCSLLHHLELPFPIKPYSPLFVVKSGSEFGLSDGQTLGVWSWSGELARQLFEREPCVNSSCDGMFGLTPLRADSGWRLLALDRTASGASARAWRMAEASLPEAVPLFGPQFSGLVSTFDLRPSRDGTRAVFANGHRLITPNVTFAALAADGRMVATELTLEIPSSAWEALTVVPTEHAGAISVIAELDDPRQRIWLLRELNSSGQLVFSSQVSLPTDYRCLGGGRCQIVEDAEGYSVHLGSNRGVPQIAQLRRDRPNELVIKPSLMPPGGVLLGSLTGMFVFGEDERTETSVRTRFIGLPQSAAAEAQTLVVTPTFDRQLNPKIQLIAVGGSSLTYGFQTPTSVVLEELTCSTGF